MRSREERGEHLDELDGCEDEVGGSVGSGRLQREYGPSVLADFEASLRERKAEKVAARSLEPATVGRRDPNGGLEVEARVVGTDDQVSRAAVPYGALEAVGSSLRFLRFFTLGNTGGQIFVGDNAEGIVNASAIWEFLRRFDCPSCGR